MTDLSITSAVKMSDGNLIPILGFGVFQLDDPAVCEASVETALDAGYRHVDTAFKYGNEAPVGNAIERSAVAREDVFLTTKTVMDDQTPGHIKEEFARSLERLKTGYVDLLLIHWPPVDALLPAAWDALAELKASGTCRSIGVSNMSVQRFDEVFFKHTDLVPAVNQVELHVYNQQPELVDYCRQKGMALEAYMALAQGARLANPGKALVDIAARHGKSVVQVMLRFLAQQDIVTLVKSQTPERIKENAAIFDFCLNDEDMAALKQLDEGLFIQEWTPDGHY